MKAMKKTMEASPMTACSFVPHMMHDCITKWLVDGTGVHAVGQSFDTVCMLADISGFTRLSDQLCLLGPSGVDALSSVLNCFFDSLITIVDG
jgi:hypothetical protein